MTIIKATRCAPLQNQSKVCVVMVTLSLTMLFPSQAQPRLVKQFTVANSMRAEKTNAQHTAMNQSMAVAQATFGKEFRALILRVVIVSTVVTPGTEEQHKKSSGIAVYKDTALARHASLQIIASLYAVRSLVEETAQMYTCNHKCPGLMKFFSFQQSVICPEWTSWPHFIYMVFCVFL